MINQVDISDDRALEVEKALQQILAEHEKIGPCEFEVQRYFSSLQRLVISTTPIGANGSPQYDQRQFLLFEGVSFMQLIPFWKEEPLLWISREQRRGFFDRIGLASFRNHLPCLVHAKVGQMELYVAFVSLDFCKSMPQMTGEHKL